MKEEPDDTVKNEANQYEETNQPTSPLANDPGTGGQESNSIPRDQRNIASAENEYWKTMQQVADYDLKIKTLQHKYEIERMSMDRAVHVKKMVLTELKIREKQQILNIHAK